MVSVYSLVVLCVLGVLAVEAVAPYGAYRPVYCDVEILTIEAVNGASQTFSADFYLTTVYQDAVVNVTTTPHKPIPQGAAYDSVDLQFVNSQSASWQYKKVYATATRPGIVSDFTGSTAAGSQEVAGMNWIRTEERIQGTFGVEMSLLDFPFDKQFLRMELESSNHVLSDGVFVKNIKTDTTARIRSITEWAILSSEVVVGESHYPLFNETYSRMDFKVHMLRKPTFYLDKVVSGIAMLVIMTWLLFSLPIMDSNRQTTASTTFLAVVSYIFIVTADVPKVAYTTKLGFFINFSLGQIFGSYAYFCVDTLVDRHADSVEAEALKEAKRQWRIAKRKGEAVDSARQIRSMKLSVEEADQIDGAPDDGLVIETEDDVEVEGWWDTWREYRHKLDVVIVTILCLSYSIICPLLLKYEV